MGSSYTPSVNLHSPGPIGDVTPGSAAFTSISSTLGMTANVGAASYGGVMVTGSNNPALTAGDGSGNQINMAWGSGNVAVFATSGYNFPIQFLGSEDHFFAHGNRIMTVTTTGAGIFNTAPAFALDVTGAGNFTSSLKSTTLTLTAVPTTNPHVTGQIYSNAGVLMLSSG